MSISCLENGDAVKQKRPISVSEMSKLAGFSRQRFYDLIEKGVFPAPIRTTSRPMYPPELQGVVLAVCETGVGANGEYVLFNAKRSKTTKASQESNDDHFASVVESLAALGLSVTKKQVGEAVKELGISDVESTDSIKAIFLHLKS